MSRKYAMSHSEIAAILGCTKEDVERVEYSALVKLRKHPTFAQLLLELVRMQRVPLDVDHYVTGNLPDSEIAYGERPR